MRDFPDVAKDGAFPADRKRDAPRVVPFGVRAPDRRFPGGLSEPDPALIAGIEARVARHPETGQSRSTSQVPRPVALGGH